MMDDDFQPLFTNPQSSRRKLDNVKKRDRNKKAAERSSKKCRESRSLMRPADAQNTTEVIDLENCSDVQIETGPENGIGSQMNALFRICSEAERETQTKLMEESLDCDEDIEISSLMTQVQRPIQNEEQPVFEEEAEPSLEELDIQCPICKMEISNLSLQEREDHTNSCLDKSSKQHSEDESSMQHQEEEILKDVSNAFDTDPVVKFLEKLNLSKFASIFVEQEIDWDTLQWLTDEDLTTLGISTFGPRKKILVALQEMKQGNACSENPEPENSEPQTAPAKKYITDFFGGSSGPGPSKTKNGPRTSSKVEPKNQKPGNKKSRWSQKSSEPPHWKTIRGTRFRVDAFQYLTNDCSHWFLTHFHSDHYQGLTKGFRYGKIYCSLITARLVNLRIGVPWDRLHSLPMNERTSIDGVWVTLVDANHCPGAAMILFEPPGGEAVLHTGDFRYCDAMVKCGPLVRSRIRTLILDTTYCDPQYDFPRQENVIQFVIDAIQAETFNPKTLFLIGTYTLGKERLFLEVARVLKKKIYVGAVKRRMLGCIDLSEEDLNWITTNDKESCIHIVPLWSIASFKRMASISRHYNGRYNTIVSFSPTGWSIGRGKKRTPGKRWQQGTIVRYEVPYSEHSSFSELKSFVKLIGPETIIPSVNNSSREAALSMIKSLR